MSMRTLTCCGSLAGGLFSSSVHTTTTNYHYWLRGSVLESSLWQGFRCEECWILGGGREASLVSMLSRVVCGGFLLTELWRIQCVCAYLKTIHHGIIIDFQYSGLQASSFTHSCSDSGTISHLLPRCSHPSYIHHPSRATLMCHLVVLVGVFVIPFFPPSVDAPQTVQGVIGPSLTHSLYPHAILHELEWPRCVILVGCFGGGVCFSFCSIPTWHLQSSICSIFLSTRHHMAPSTSSSRLGESIQFSHLVLPSGTSDLFCRLRGSFSRCYPPL